jgi:hypothetical protein
MENVTIDKLKEFKELAKDFFSSLRMGLNPSYHDSIGNENKTTIPANTPKDTLALEIENTLGYDIIVQGIQLRYFAGLDNCIITIKKTKTDIVSGTTQFCQLGNRQEASVGLDIVPIKFELGRGEKVFAYVQTKNNAIDVGHVSLQLFAKNKKN